MKTTKNILLVILLILGISSCDYLDIVPDEKATAEDAFEDASALERYIYSCYAYLPQPNHGSGSLDFMTGDEVITAFEHESFARFPKGTYSADSPVISYWNTFFSGIRQCYLFIESYQNTMGVPEKTKKDYLAQAKFLIGYYHLLLIRCYGPVILVKETPSINTSPEDYLPRSSFEDCVQFVCDMLDDAAKDLPAKRTVRNYGLATSVVARAMKAKLLLYAASPLFNGNSEFYSDFKDKEGNELMPLQYDPNKWIIARDALKEAIDLAESNGYELYQKTDLDEGNKEPTNPTQHMLRYNIMDKGNPEILWADCRGEGSYGLQNKSFPFSAAAAWNGVAPTLAMLKRFYTENGLPIEEDPNYDTNNMFEVITVDKAHADIADEGAKTFSFNLDREPRYYAWVTFQGGFYEVLNAQSKGAYDNDESYKKYSSDGSGKLVCDFVNGGNTSRGTRTNNYSPSGFLNKKGCNPAFSVSTDLKDPLTYPWPIMRLAELYLSYAEACVETGDLSTAQTYLNKVRTRAGIPTVKESWEKIAGKSITQDLLRKVVRQERQIEFYLENQNFWDLRRWKIADHYFNVKAKGMNIDAGDIESFVQITEIPFERKFESPTNYLLPIPLADVNRNERLVQNPGY